MNAVTEARRDKVQMFLADAEEKDAIAGALEAIADMIRDASVPVQRYAKTYQAVERRLRGDAKEKREQAASHRSRIEDLQRAEEARQNWQEHEEEPSLRLEPPAGHGESWGDPLD